MKSFTFLTWYTLFVKNEFQDEYLVERLRNEPPSRTWPFLMSPTLPVMPGRSFAAGRPLYQ